ncbi:TetR/AcrR family transcriptional regulator [Angustibacter luteus]|uniref:TetR/AcrR family transcriptional regulator n=1 Tax=Angustibacter luteus TaxID=658456 RepID=A0ABW1J9B8_9ACTN
MNSTEMSAAPRRMSGEQRRDQILKAALGAFAAGGYAGTSTDQVARAAGVSQPYVVRLFGSKQELFAQVYEHASKRVIDALAAVPAGPDAKHEMGEAYVRLLADRDLLLVIMHGFIAGADPKVGHIARFTLAEAFRLHRERTGASADDARMFVAHGMLINVLMASGAPLHLGEDPDLDALTECTFGAAMSDVAALAAGA